jgi:biopolymer transport protein TolQ
MSIKELILDASPVVQAVMVLLMLMSIASWAVALSKSAEIRKARKLAFDFDELFWKTPELSNLFSGVSNGMIKESGSASIFKEGFKEFIRLKKQGVSNASDLVSATQRTMKVAFTKEVEKIEDKIPMLATVGSSAPYIGLFGTVLGVMHAFSSLGNMQNATLSSVAPGISEALIATAVGLFAAIPATIYFNRLSVKSEKVITQYENFAEGFLTIIQRQAHLIEKRIEDNI